MNRHLLSFMVSMGLALACVLVFVSPAVKGTTAVPSTAISALPAQGHEARQDLHAAEDKLREARGLLANAPGEYGGHRDKAIKKIDEALAEVHEAWQSH